MGTLSDIANIISNIAQVSTALTTISTGLGLVQRDNTTVSSDGTEVLPVNNNSNGNGMVPNININFIVSDKNKLPAFDSIDIKNGIGSKFDI